MRKSKPKRQPKLPPSILKAETLHTKLAALLKHIDRKYQRKSK